MTNAPGKIFFDTDCLQAFILVGREDILTSLYPGRIIVPGEVYREFCFPGQFMRRLKERLDLLLSGSAAEKRDIVTGTAEYAHYIRLISPSPEGKRIIGRGEASALALAITNGGIVASNNLSDVSAYAVQYGLALLTAGDIMLEAYNACIIDIQTGDVIWAEMLAKGRKIGAASFTECLRSRPGYY